VSHDLYACRAFRGREPQGEREGGRRERNDLVITKFDRFDVEKHTGCVCVCVCVCMSVRYKQVGLALAPMARIQDEHATLIS
jgi:hypothetical protein